MTTSAAFAVFDTAIGPCGIAWEAGRIVGLNLPEADAGKTRARMARRFPAGAETEPPPLVLGWIAAIRALLDGRESDLAALPLALERVQAFERGVYDIARAIPPGETLTYGEIAARLGEPDAARAVGTALGRNPFPIVVPCHRVVAADGKLGGFSANGGVTTKRRLLAIEQAAFPSLPLFARARS